MNKPVEVVWIYVVWGVGMYAETALAPPYKVRIFILKKYDVYTILPTDWNHYNVSTRHAFKCL